MSARRPQRGFTLVEMIIAAGLLGFLAVAATFFWVNGFTLVRTVNSDSAAIAEARAVLERLAREIREVKYDTAAGAYCVSTMTSTRIVFNKTAGPYAAGCGGAAPTTANNDFAVDVQLPSGTTNLNLGYAGSLAAPAVTRILTAYAGAFAIRYLDGNYAVTGSASALRFVELSLTVQPSGVQATPTRTVVALRNG
jgi:prepilin-type N-terminal cleavage/methylation domain-containing protein